MCSGSEKLGKKADMPYSEVLLSQHLLAIIEGTHENCYDGPLPRPEF
jgi:hypothetical protein